MVNVRLARPDDDFGELGRILVAAYSAEPGYPGTGWYDAELLDVAGRARDALVAVAEHDERPIGCVTYVAGHHEGLSEHHDPDAATCRMLGVDPAAQGWGAGRALLQWCVDRCRRDGKRRFVFSSGAWQVRAHRLYYSMGFVRWPDHDSTPHPGVKLLGFAREFDV